MIKIQHNTKSFISALSAAVILALTTSGFGGSGRDTLTVFAETPSDGPEDIATIDKGEFEKEIQMIKEPDTKESEIKEPKMEQPGTEEQQKISDSARKGGLVVGYMMTKNAEHETEKEQTAASTAADFSMEDYQVLLKIVEAEAGVCDSRGKILVANVVLNRVNSSEFPDTIKEVVYQPSQFSPVSNGSINTCQVTAQTVECVNRALAGEDYSQGALYFMNRSASRTGAVHWFDGRLTFLFSHERHEFFK